MLILVSERIMLLMIVNVDLFQDMTSRTDDSEKTIPLKVLLSFQSHCRLGSWLFIHLHIYIHVLGRENILPKCLKEG